MMRFISVLASILVLGVLVACGGADSSSEDGKTKLTLVAFSAPREAYAEIISAFQETATGQGVELDQSYGSSGEQSRAVEAGLPADVVHFSLEPDVTRLVEAGLVDPGWSASGRGGVLVHSVVVFAVRRGNPKGIRGWDDLVRDDVKLLTPNPFTSGGARWNLMAAFGAKVRHGASEQEGLEFLRKLLANVSVQDKSARESLQTFIGGKGDVLLAYESEAILAQRNGEQLDYVVPDQTILIEMPVAVVGGGGQAERALELVDFLFSPAAQRIFAQWGYRPVNPQAAAEVDYAQPADLFTIGDLGGWAQVQERFFDREQGLVAELGQELGVSTDS